MEQQLKRQALSAAIFAAALVAAGCGGGASGESDGTSDTVLTGTADPASTSGTSGPTSSTVAATATLHVNASRVDVNDTEVPNGGDRPLQFDEPVVLGTGALADIHAGDLGLVLLLGTNMRLDGWDQPELRSSIEGGHLRVKVGENSTARFRLTTWTNVVLTTRQPGTEFIVCQEPAAPPNEPVTCLNVIKGEVEWAAKGTSTILHAGESTFSKNGDPPPEVKCLPSGDVDAWYQAALRQEPVEPLGALVLNAPVCPVDGASPSTAAPETTQGTGHKPRPPVPPVPTATPEPTDSPAPPPTDTTPPSVTTPPSDTTPPSVTTPPSDTTPPSVTTPPSDTTPPPIP
jgi:hypothetical protein